MPNLVIMMPKDENEGQHMVKTAIDYNEGPIAMRYPRGNGLGVPMDETLRTIPIGSWEVLREGSDAVILTFGTTIPMALEAAETSTSRPSRWRCPRRSTSTSRQSTSASPPTCRR